MIDWEIMMTISPKTSQRPPGYRIENGTTNNSLKGQNQGVN